LVVASLDHSGGQGSSAYSQLPMWAPSRVPDVNSRETPKWMEVDDIAAVIDGFASAAQIAVDAGCDGVEINGGQHSLIRQFLSGLTNHRDDGWQHDRLLLARQVIEAVRPRVPLLGLRLSCDELAPWAGITPEMAPAIAASLVECGVDYLVVVRGSIYTADKTRPDFHEPAGFNVELCRIVRAAVQVPVFLQGSVVNPGQAECSVTDSVCDGVEMTRAQIADPDLVAKLRAGRSEHVRPCIRCNQTCQVRDVRNPIVSCVGEPSSGRETEDPDWYTPSARSRRVVVVGAGVAGLETARVAASRGHQVQIVEREGRVGGIAAIAGPGSPLVEWLERECRGLGVEITTGSTSIPDADVTVQCTGSQSGRRDYEVDDPAMVVDIVDVRRGAPLPEGTIVVFDLAPANVRLAQRNVRVERRTLLRAVRNGEIEVEDRFTGQRRTIACAALIDCGFRLPTDPLPEADLRAGDCVAPRTIYEAVLEGRRAALAIDMT
jgi:2,4-dienoyl-CoA reductase (NADPH2)